jgi:hypothetical protein
MAAWIAGGRDGFETLDFSICNLNRLVVLMLWPLTSQRGFESVEDS